MYTVTVTGVTGDGTMRLDLNNTGDVITDSFGNTLAAAYTGGQTYTIEHTPPSATATTVPANGTYGSGQNLDFTVTFNEAVAVTGTPRIAVTLDTGGTVYAEYLSGSGTNTLTFQYTVAPGQQDLTGIVTGTSIDANGGTITDAATNHAVLTLSGEPSTAGVLVDSILPTGTSIVTVASSPNNLATEDFTVTFSTNVTGVDASDFTLHDTGSIAGTITSVTAVSGNVYTVTVTGMTGDGTMRLDLNNTGHVITDSFGNTLAAAYTGGQTYTIEHTPPSATATTVPANGTYASGQNLDFTVTFNEAVAVTGTPRIAVTLDTGGTVYANYLSGSGTNTLTFQYTVAPGQQDLTGIVAGASIDANGGAIKDAAANNALLALNGAPSTAGIDVDAIPPTVASIDTNGASLTDANAVTFTVTFSKDVTGVAANDFTLTGTGGIVGTIASVTAVNGSTYTVQVNGISGNGTLRLDLNSSGTGIADPANNVLVGGYTGGESYTFDHVPPQVVSVGTPAAGDYLVGQSLNFTVNFSKPVIVDTSTGQPSIAVALDNGGTAYATYLSGGGTSTLTFRYVVAAGDLNTKGISLATSLSLNGATLHDAAGNNADLALTGVGSTAGVDVGVAPLVAATGRGLLPGTEAGAPISPVNPFIWLLPPVGSSRPLAQGGAWGAMTIDLSGLSVGESSVIDRIVNPDPVELVALTSTEADRSNDLLWRPTHSADQLPPVKGDALRETVLLPHNAPVEVAREKAHEPVSPPVARNPPAGGKASLAEQFTRYGHSAWQQERSQLVGSARRVVRQRTG